MTAGPVMVVDGELRAVKTDVLDKTNLHSPTDSMEVLTRSQLSGAVEARVSVEC